MTPQVSSLESLRESVADYLRGRSEFAGVGVVTRKDGDLANTVQDQVARVGVSIEVFIKSARPTQSQSFAVRFDPVVLGVTVYEQVLVNQDPATGTGKGAFWLVEQILAALKMWTPPDVGSVLMPDAAGPQNGQAGKNPTLLVLTQDFLTVLQLAPRTP